MLKTGALPIASSSWRCKGHKGTYSEAGVEADVIGLAHLVVLFLCTVQGSDSDGGGPV